MSGESHSKRSRQLINERKREIMNRAKQIAHYAGGIIGAVIFFHIMILTIMTIGITSGSDQIVHTGYWDGLLRFIINLVN